jgi:ferredoxin, 2Fe-2S
LNMYKVKINFEDKSIPSQEFIANKGDTLLDVALDNDIELHHNCGAVCACSTCHVYVNAGMDTLPELSDKEEDFIDRAINPTLSSRLACQCILKADMEMTIPDQKQFHGH